MEFIDLDRLAKTLSLRLTASEKEMLFTKFSDTLTKIATLKELKVLDITPTYSVNNLSNIFQIDMQLEQTLSQEETLANVPEKSRGLVVVEGDYRYD